MRYRKTCALYDEVNMGNPGNVPWCSDKGLDPDCENCMRPGKTNADRIRGMSDEELAEKIAAQVSCMECPLLKMCKRVDPRRCINCIDMWLSWLKSPADKEDEG